MTPTLQTMLQVFVFLLFLCLCKSPSKIAVVLFLHNPWDPPSTRVSSCVASLAPPPAVSIPGPPGVVLPPPWDSRASTPLPRSSSHPFYSPAPGRSPYTILMFMFGL